VYNAINNANVNLPTGILWGVHKAFTVQANRPARPTPRSSRR